MYSFLNDYSEGAHYKIIEALSKINNEQNTGNVSYLYRKGKVSENGRPTDHKDEKGTERGHGSDAG